MTHAHSCKAPTHAGPIRRYTESGQLCFSFAKTRQQPFMAQAGNRRPWS